MPENKRSGREPFEYIELLQDFCEQSYSVAPCTATLAIGGRECYNTRATCQDPANYTLGSLSLLLCKPQVLPSGGGPWLPFLRDVKVTPGQINPGGGNRNVQALGGRATISITLDDRPHTDRIVDPYIDARKARIPTYDPLKRGTFFTKWRARNPFYLNRVVRHVSGYLKDGQVVDTITRTFVVTAFSGPSADGTVTMTGKDLLSLLLDRKAQAPRASGGKIDTAITDSSGSLTLVPAGVGDEEYPASGFVRVGSEVMAFTRAGDVLTLTRAQFNTLASGHDADETVQLCLRYDAESPAAILQDLLENYTGIPTANLDLAGWAQEVTDFLPRLYSAIITEPTAVDALVSEMCEQMSFYVWHDERDDLIKIRAVRPASGEEIIDLTQSRHIIEDTLSVADNPDQMLTRVVVNYAPRDPTKSVDELTNYAATEVIVAAGSEQDEQNRGVQSKTINSRWIGVGGGAAAVDLAERLLRRYGQIPRTLSFSLDAKDRDVWVSDFVRISHRLITDDTGESLPINVQVMKATEAQSGSTFSYTGQTFISEDPPVAGEFLLLPVSQNNLNLSDLFDSQYGVTPVSGDIVRVRLRNGVIIGSDSTASHALVTGSWPAGVVLILDIDAGAFVVGRGGDGANGGSVPSSGSTNGQNGGPALFAGHPTSVNNSGVIGGGGGGGGGGASGTNAANSTASGGGGGGGGAGFSAGGAGGTAGLPGTYNQRRNGMNGGSGGLDVFGVGGEGANFSGSSRDGGVGGNGGQLGLAGQSGGPRGSGLSGTNAQNAGSGGAPGNAIEGGSLITWINKGDVRGPEVA
jgi:hypothetical protein